MGEDSIIIGASRACKDDRIVRWPRTGSVGYGGTWPSFAETATALTQRQLGSGINRTLQLRWSEKRSACEL